jgi:hypothetical protein
MLQRQNARAGRGAFVSLKYRPPQELLANDALAELRGLVDGFVREYDPHVAYEDPVDIHRGYYGRLPEEGSAQ